MSTITLKPHNVPISLPSGLAEDTLVAFPAFNNWIKTLTKSLSLQSKNSSHPFHRDPYELKSISIQSYDVFGGGRLGFLKLTADVSNAAGEKLPGSVFLRGPSVAMLIMLIPDDTPVNSDERYAILTVQARVPAGSLEFVELPAGMVDNDGTFAGTAAKEIEEELGMKIPEAELRCLSDMAVQEQADSNREGLPQAMFPSAGGCDEHIPIYVHEKRVPRAQLKEWTGKLTGLRDHGEKITLKLVRMQDLWREGGRDAKSLAAVALWEGLRREGKL